jgi:hypothetical protein
MLIERRSEKRKSMIEKEREDMTAKIDTVN